MLREGLIDLAVVDAADESLPHELHLLYSGSTIPLGSINGPVIILGNYAVSEEVE